MRCGFLKVKIGSCGPGMPFESFCLKDFLSTRAGRGSRASNSVNPLSRNLMNFRRKRLLPKHSDLQTAIAWSELRALLRCHLRSKNAYWPSRNVKTLETSLSVNLVTRNG